jgi:hypothetical protein
MAILAASGASAQDAYPPPPAAYAPPPSWPSPSPSPVAPAAPAPRGFELRHRVGAQIGGTGVLQAVYRYRLAGPLHLEAGGAGADHGANLSAGILIGSPIANRWFPYVGFGGAAMWAFGPRTPDGCDAKTTACPLVTDSDSYLVAHARIGIGVALGPPRKHLLSIDAGGWWGVHHSSRTDVAGVETQSKSRVLTPMAGISYFFAFGR